MSTRNMQGVVSPVIPASIAGGSNYSGVYTLDQLNRLNAVYPNHIGNSLRFRSSASAYLSRTPASAGNQQTMTFSMWVKRGTITSSGFGYLIDGGAWTSGGEAPIMFYNDTIQIENYNGSSNVFTLITNQVFRDPSAWYHIVVAVDTTQATASNRIKLYVNGSQVTSFSTETYPSQNSNTGWNTTATSSIGRWQNGASRYFDGYMAEINFIDGQALTPSAFGKFYYETGVWCPSKYSGTYGTNGFYLKFSDTTSTTTLCYDYSGNSNNWTPNNISLTAGSTYDSMLDSPTNYDNGGNGVGNYAVLNPLNLVSPSTLSAGNLNFDTGIAGGGGVNANWQFPLTGKFYFEFSNFSNIPAASGRVLCANSLWESNTGIFYIDGASVATIGGYTDGDTLAFATDCAAQTIAVYKNNTLLYTASAGANLYLSPVAGFRDGSGSNGITGSINFGQRPFAYTPPTGYKALNTQNLPAPSIQNGSNFMAATTYTGNGATQSIVNAVNGVSFQPDFIWIKSRSAGYDNRLQNSVVGMQGLLISNSTGAEYTASSGDYPTVTSSGFTLPYGTNGLYYNGSGVTFAAWQWKAGGTAVTNTAGSITSQVSANTTAGFSVVTYSAGASNSTVGHGLGVAPSFIIAKPRTNTAHWVCYHVSLGVNSYLLLDQPDAVGSITNYWASSSTTFGVSLNGYNNNVGNMVAYCFAAIPGYSAFGSYTGNGSNDGPFVYCGFRPRYVMYKNASVGSAGYDWVIIDSSRSTYNIAVALLDANLSAAENTNANAIDILSNGFKLRDLGAAGNGSGNTIIYAAFAENPFNYSLAR